MSFVTRFLETNRRFSRRLTPEHVHEANVFGAYRKLGTIVLSHPNITKVADVGAGKAWQFPQYYKKWYNIHLVGLDVDGDEMSGNAALDTKVVCDVVEAIPLPEGSIDLVMVHSGIEHFHDNERFLLNAFQVLRPGGFVLAQFPGRYAPFAIVNRVLPGWLSKRVLRTSMGESHDLGFQAHYDRTSYRAFKRMATRAGFDEIYYVPGYFSSSYVEFFSPLFALSYLYDLVRYGLGIRTIASYNLFLLRKRTAEPDAEPFQLYAWR